jgi:hypothetical protein
VAAFGARFTLLQKKNRAGCNRLFSQARIALAKPAGACHLTRQV